MKYRVTTSTEDGDNSREYDLLSQAEEYAKDYMNGFQHWNHVHFNQVESDKYLRLYKTRKGHVCRIEIIPDIETTLRHINSDVDTLADIEYVGLHVISQTSIVFVDDMGNQYEYDGVCISEGKLKIRIKPIYNIKIK